ncbi:uncharacterized protein G2W53_044193 [Senna tora]|uniref:Uncharacterized protein n=1 Tax=Senna tora TaxID=362788 RepID=A0A834SQ50_9FABA|nr:uncharacterized protein G2W53_044193 [Senna tora]
MELVPTTAFHVADTKPSCA